MNSKNRLNMIDICGTVQCQLEIHISNGLDAKNRQMLQNADNRTNSDSRISDLLIDQTFKTYEQFRYPNGSLFIYLDSQVQRLPLIAFAVLSTQIRVDPPKAEAFFIHLLKISLNRLHLTKETLKLEECTGQ